MPEPMDGITDAIIAADVFLVWARSHRDRPGGDGPRSVMEARDDLIAKLQRLGPVGEEG